MAVSLLHNRLTMHEFLLREEKRLCEKYGVSDIEKVLAIQYKILENSNKCSDDPSLPQ